VTDVADLLLLAQLCNIAYVDDEAAQQAQVAALGFKYLGRYENTDHQAFLAMKGTRYVLAISGTRFSDGNIPELLDDENVFPQSAGDFKVMAGFYAGQGDLYAWAEAKVPAGEKFEITGHSLGGARAHLAPLWVPADRLRCLTTFGAPKAATAAYWTTFSTPLARVVHERDLWAGWPLLPPWTQPGPMLWLHNGALTLTTEKWWPGGLSPADHSITSGYIKALAALQPAPGQPTTAPRAPGASP